MKTGNVNRRDFIKVGTAVIAVHTIAPALTWSSPKKIKVGVLHSLSGTMAISEVYVKNATLLAIEEINRKGGVLGYTIEPIIEDGASDPATFAQKAQKLILTDKVVTVFGGWTSASRKAMLPVFERYKNLLWYPVQFEGNECSPNIIYTGAQPNQQILPALEWALKQGYKKFFLVGSDYVFPRTANLILKKHIQKNNAIVVGEEYVPLGGTDFSAVVNKIINTKPDIVFNTINGDSNVAFFKQMASAGVGPKVLPVISFSIAEQEAKAIGIPLLEGSYAAWNYFMSLKNKANFAFIKAYQEKYGKASLITDPMAHGYMGVYLWKMSVEKAGSFDPTIVRKAATELPWVDSPLGKIKIAKNQSLYQTAYIGKLSSDGQFDIVWSSKKAIEPEPYDQLAFPGKKCVL